MDKEAAQVFFLEQETIAQEQGSCEDKKNAAELYRT